MDKSLQQTRFVLSLTAICFLAPVIQYYIRGRYDFGLAQEDETFVRGYVRYGMIVLGLLVLLGIVSVMQVVWGASVLTVMTQVLLGATLVSLFMGIGLLLSGQSLAGDAAPVNQRSSKSVASQQVLGFVPLVNIYRYYRANYPSSYREGILGWMVFVLIAAISPQATLPILVLLCLIVRATTLSVGIELLPGWTRVSGIAFVRHPEAVVARMWGIIMSKVMVGLGRWHERESLSYRARVQKRYRSTLVHGSLSHILSHGLVMVIGLWWLMSAWDAVSFRPSASIDVFAACLVIGRIVLAWVLRQAMPILPWGSVTTGAHTTTQLAPFHPLQPHEHPPTPPHVL